jgi:hypothetical protein
MSRIVRPLMSPLGRVGILGAATIWLVAIMAFSPSAPVAAEATLFPDRAETTFRVEELEGLEDPLYGASILTASSTGDLYVSDTGNNRVLQLRPTTDHGGVDVVQVFGSKGEGPGELKTPSGVAIDASGNLFVADDGLGRITKYAPDGTYLASVTQRGVSSIVVTSTGEVLAWPGEGEALLSRYSEDLTDAEPVLRKPNAGYKAWTHSLFALDSEDNLYWLDNRQLVMRVFDRELNQVAEWPIDPPGLREDAEYRLKEARKVMPQANLDPILHMDLSASGDRLLLTYVMHKINSRVVYLYTLDGELEQQWVAEGEVFGATMDSDGVLIAADGDGLNFSVGTRTTASNSP